jgi:hypothetical protein
MSKSKRTRTGCLCCRRRHKKCDEQKPSCKFCISKGLVCEWPVKGSVFVNYNSEQPVQQIHSVQHVQAQPIHFNTNAFSTLDLKSIKSPSPNSCITFTTSPKSRAASIASPVTLEPNPQRNYNYSNLLSVSLPPLKLYHFVPRTTTPSLDPIQSPHKKRLSVDSLLN